MADRLSSLAVEFRCPAELLGIIPPPTPASTALPDWLRAMPAQAFHALNAKDESTVKRCPPFVDAMTSGFLIPLMCDVRVEDGEFIWDNDLPPGGSLSFVRSPISFHDSSQVVGSPLFADDRFLIKFNNLWTVRVPEGYAVLFTHPFTRFDLPFTTLTGVVDCDRYSDNWIHFPAHWHDLNFKGVLPKGTPIAQCIAIRRESWSANIAPFSEQDAQNVHRLTTAIEQEPGLYRRKFRV